MLPVNPDRMRTEVDQIVELVTAIKQSLDNGIPGDDLPANDIDQEVFEVRLKGELMLASQRLLALAEVLG